MRGTEQYDDATEHSEYGDYNIDRVDEDYCLFAITRKDGQPISAFLEGRWTTKREAIAAIDALTGSAA